jgi:trimeric autotransporter adhesin
MKIFKLFVAFTLICFALSPAAQAVVPAPDGGYPNNNTAEGTNALFSGVASFGNTAVGFSALYNNAIGNDNTAVGDQALYYNTAYQNTATGRLALFYNQSGTYNTAVGGGALFYNVDGSYNTGIGALALYGSQGSGNTATGFEALYGNLGSENTATGYQALHTNAGRNNTATGYQALYTNALDIDGGDYNTASGWWALRSNTTGSFNHASGAAALAFNTTGNQNTAEGVGALLLDSTGSNNIALGIFAGLNLTTGDNNIDIGNQGVTGEANTIHIGTQGTQTATYIAGISGTSIDGTPVVVNASGQLGVTLSSRRFKKDIASMDTASDAILSLRPVTFHYKTDSKGTPQFGLIAEEVARVSPALVLPDKDGRPYTVRYEAVNAMLLNEFLKEHKAFVEEQRKVREQGATIAHLQQQIDALTAGLQKVSAELEASKPAPQTVANNQ